MCAFYFEPENLHAQLHPMMNIPAEHAPIEHVKIEPRGMYINVSTP